MRLPIHHPLAFLFVTFLFAFPLSAQRDAAGLSALKNGDYKAAYAILSSQAEKKKTAVAGHFGLAQLHSTAESGYYDLVKANDHGKSCYELLREIKKRDDRDALKTIGISTRNLRQLREEISEKAVGEARAKGSPEDFEAVLKKFRLSPEKKAELKLAYAEAVLKKVGESPAPEKANAVLESYKRELNRYHSQAFAEGEALVLEKFISQNGWEEFEAFKSKFPGNRFSGDSGAEPFLKLVGSSNLDGYQGFVQQYPYSAFNAIARDSATAIREILEEYKQQITNTLQESSTYEALAQFGKDYQTQLSEKVFRQERALLEQKLFKAFIEENGWGAFPQFREAHPKNRYVLDNAAKVYQGIAESGQLEKFQAFRRNHPDSHYNSFATEQIDRLMAIKKELAEKAEAAIAQFEQPAELYAFQEQHRDDFAAHAPEWNEKLDRLVLNQFLKEHSFADFAHFQQSFPNNAFAADPAAGIFLKIAGTGKLDSFESFIKAHSTSLFRSIAGDSIRYWKDFRREFSREVKNALAAADNYEEVVAVDDKYRKRIARYAPAMQEQVDRELLEAYVEKTGGRQLNVFKKKHPANKSWDGKEVNAFNSLLSDGNLMDYRSFSATYRNSVFRKIVRDSITRLEAEIMPEKRISFTDLQYQLKSDLRARNWSAALAKLREAGPAYSGDTKLFADLQQLIEAPERGMERKELSKNINGSGTAYVPVITADGKTLYFCGRNFPDNMGWEDIYVSHKEGAQWSDAQIISELSTSESNESPLSISADGNTLLLFLSGDIGYSEKTSDGWSKPRLYPSILNIGDWQSDAMISADGRVMIFVHGRGWGTDNNIYISKKQPDGSWGEAIKLGENINTGGDERTPFLHPDMETLYFSSAGRGGLGGMDVFVTTRLDDSWENWSEARNLGKEVNTVDDDWGYKISTDGKTAFFAAQISGYGSKLFEVDLPREFRPGQVTTIEGKVEGLADMESATIVVIDSKTKEEITRITSEPGTGAYFIVVPKDVSPEIKVEKEGVFSQPTKIETVGTEKEENANVVKNLEVVDFNKKKVEELSLTFEDVLFETDQYTIREEMKGTLDELAGILVKKDLKITISGYTDDTGTAAYNKALSQKRADSVKEYLIHRGCKAEKITAAGQGEHNPIASNETELGRAKNRRVEFSFQE